MRLFFFLSFSQKKERKHNNRNNTILIIHDKYYSTPDECGNFFDDQMCLFIVFHEKRHIDMFNEVKSHVLLNIS